MYIPGFSAASLGIDKRLSKRKGGSSGGGRSSGSKGSSGSKSGKSASSSSRPPPYTPGSPPPKYTVEGGSATRGASDIAGGGRSYKIANGHFFSGATAGSGTRSGVYTSGGYTGRGYSPYFPYTFWPVYYDSHPNYHGSRIYGPRRNDSRPGGELQSYTLLPSWGLPAGSPVNGQRPPANNAFALYGDANSVQDLVPIIAGTCAVTGTVYGANISISPFNAVQYYRESSFVLSLEDYNNAFPDIEMPISSQGFTVPPFQQAALPSGVNQSYFNCLNATIGSYIGLIDSDYATDAAMSSMTVGASAGYLVLAAVLINWLA